MGFERGKFSGGIDAALSQGGSAFDSGLTRSSTDAPAKSMSARDTEYAVTPEMRRYLDSYSAATADYDRLLRERQAATRETPDGKSSKYDELDRQLKNARQRISTAENRLLQLGFNFALLGSGGRLK